MQDDGPRARVLIVDDNVHNLEVLHRTLHRQGYTEIGSAQGIEHASDLLDVVDPEVLLVDVDLLIMDGYAFLDGLRRSTRWRDLPVLVVVSRQPAATIRTATARGATGFISLPFNALEITYKIEQAVRGVGPRAAEIADLTDPDPATSFGHQP